MVWTRPSSLSLIQRACNLRNVLLRCRQYHVSSKLRDSPADEPIRYSKSKAYKHRAMETFESPTRDIPYYQPLSVVFSTAAFLIYFCYLREENDLDDQIGSSLYDKIPGLEEKQLHLSIEYERSMGKSTEALENRLKEVQNKERTT